MDNEKIFEYCIADLNLADRVSGQVWGMKAVT